MSLIIVKVSAPASPRRVPKVCLRLCVHEVLIPSETFAHVEMEVIEIGH